MATATITIALCAEDRARLDKILAALESSRPNCERCAGSVAEAMVAITHEIEGQQPIETLPEVPATPEPEKPAEAEKQAPAVSLSDIQQKVVALSAAGKKAEVRDIVTKYATRVSAIPEDKAAEVWEKLTALED